MYIIGGIGMVILLLALIVLYRTIRLKPTSAQTATVRLDETERAENYGKMLAKLIQVETVSARGQTDFTKFYNFHEKLETMFPLVHKHCEKHEFEGSLLFRWKGNGDHEPILLMSHHDVVEAGQDWEHPPFSGHIDEKGRVWGRGTVDTKGSLFCIMMAVEEMIRDGFQPKCDVYL